MKTNYNQLPILILIFLVVYEVVILGEGISLSHVIIAYLALFNQSKE